MKKTIISILLFAVFALPAGTGLAITKAGQPLYVIVVPEKSTPHNNRTASLLQRQIQAVTGAKLPVVNESTRRNRNAIFVGPVKTPVTNGLDPEKMPQVLFRDKHILIGGNPKRDVMRDAVYFFRKYCGIAWTNRPVIGTPTIPDLTIYPSGVIKSADRFDCDTISLSLNGKTSYVIVVPIQTTREINEAASELARHLQAATGIKFPIGTEKTIRKRKAIFISRVPGTEKIFDQGTAGIVFKDGNILITADDKTKLLENVYRFLENNCSIPRGIHRRKNVTPKPTLIISVPRALPRGAMVISENGKTRYAIVLPEQATPTLHTAANELAAHLHKMTGINFPIISESRHQGEPAFFIGPVAAAKKVFDDYRFTKAKQDTTAIKFSGKNIFLNGHPESGPLYAVYTFLEDYCGVRWWTEGESFIPKYPVFGVVPKDYQFAPVLISRGAFYRAASGVQAARNKANDMLSYIPAGYGSSMRVIGKVHTFNQFMPPAKYFDKHPEYFPLINGKRQNGDDYQLCLTNPEMTAEFTRICLQKIAENPTFPIIAISQNDSGKMVPCACPECDAIIKEDNASGLYLRFVNKVAAEIKKKYPEKFVMTIAYHESVVPPKKTVPLDNVIIQFATISMDFSQPLESGTDENNVKTRNYLRQWSKICSKLFIWNYVCNFRNYVYPHPNYRNLAADLRYFIKSNAIGVFEQGDFACSIGDFVRPRAWILQKLLWNPDLDEKALAEEFFNNYYGPAGPILRKYLHYLCGELEKSGARLPTDYLTPDFWLTYDIILKAREIYAEAEKAVAGHPVFAERVRRDKLSLDYAYLNSVAAKVRHDRLNGIPFHPDTKKIMDLANEFIRESARWKPIQFREHVTFAGHAEQLRDKLTDTLNIPFEKIAKIAPEIRKPQTAWDHLPPSFFVPYHVGRWCFYAKDPAAIAGQAIRLPNTHKNWAYQGTIGKEYSQRAKKWKFKFEVRCEAAVNTGKALALGIYDSKNRKDLYSTTVNVSACRGKNYTFIETPPIELGEKMLVWCAPEKRRPEEVSNSYVSSVIMIACEEDQK